MIFIHIQLYSVLCEFVIVDSGKKYPQRVIADDDDGLVACQSIAQLIECRTIAQKKAQGRAGQELEERVEGQGVGRREAAEAGG